MLNRQRMILALLDQAGGSLSHTTLVKLAFLLREETPVQGDRTFYGFVPYKHGPFSFALYRELQTLERDGYVGSGDTWFALARRTARLSREQIERLKSSQRAAVRQVVEQYARMRQRDLLHHVYRRYPWYAINSEHNDALPEEMPERPTREVAAYTVGYERQSVDGFFNRLLGSGMSGILDVRANPVSRKYGFAKSSMSRIANHLGLTYHHLPELGIESRKRASLSDFDSYQRLLQEYEQKLLPRRARHIRKAAELLRSAPLALLCVEEDVRCCHRGRLAKRIARESGLAVEHL